MSIEKNVMSNQRINPVVKIFEEVQTSTSPAIQVSLRLHDVPCNEHWQTGVLTRWLPWLIEAEPQMFCEMSLELAKLREIKTRQW